MKRAILKVVGAVAAVGPLFVLASTAFAIGGSSGNTISLVNPLGTASFMDVVDNVTNFLLVDIGIPLTVIMVIVGAFQMITSSGDPEKFTKGRKTLIYSAIGFAVLLLATNITSILQSILNGS